MDVDGEETQPRKRWVLGFRFNSTEYREWIQLQSCNEYVHSTITSIDLDSPDTTRRFTEENWRQMGDDIAKSTSLKTLHLSFKRYVEKIPSHNCVLKLSKTEARALFGSWRTYLCPLEEFSFVGMRVGRMGEVDVMKFLRMETLKSVNFANAKLDDEGARVLSEEVLGDVRLQELILASNKIGDVGANHILSAKGAVHLLRLDLTGNSLGRAGFDVVSQFLRRDDTKLKTLDLDYVEEGEKNAILVVDAISSNSSLETLDWNSKEYRGEVSEVFVDALIKSVCNDSNFMSMLQSNHVIKSFGSMTDGSYNFWKNYPKNMGRLKNILGINSAGVSVSKRIKEKILSYYLCDDFDVQPFHDMGIALMPFVVGLANMTDTNYTCSRVRKRLLSSVFRIVKHIPELVSLPSPKEMKLKHLEARNAELEKDNLSLKRKIDKLQAEIEQLRGQRKRAYKHGQVSV